MGDLEKALDYAQTYLVERTENGEEVCIIVHYFIDNSITWPAVSPFNSDSTIHENIKLYNE